MRGNTSYFWELAIAVFSWSKHGPETRFLKETGFLSTSQRLKNAIIFFPKVTSKKLIL
jgi:hypothetical protein